jgi:hypothetical protein
MDLERDPFSLVRINEELLGRKCCDSGLEHPLLLRKSGSAGNRSRDPWLCSHELSPLDHKGRFRLVLYPSQFIVY